MSILISAAIFVVLVLGLTAAGTRLYVRPKAALDRVVDTTFDSHDDPPVHPSLVFRDLVQKLGKLIPASPKDVTVMQRRLIRGGFRKENALRYLYGAKAILGVGLPLLTATLVAGTPAGPSNKFIAVIAAVAIGFF